MLGEGGFKGNIENFVAERKTSNIQKETGCLVLQTDETETCNFARRMEMKTSLLLRPEECILHVVDPQTSLMKHIDRGEQIIDKINFILDCCRILEMPVIGNTQYVKGLGEYPQTVLSRMNNISIIDKTEFNCLASNETSLYYDALPERITHPILVGVETHICVYQTATGLLQRGLKPWVVNDAVSSRNRENHDYALRRLERLGCDIGPAEMLIYELLGEAGTKKFKEILPLVTGR